MEKILIADDVEINRQLLGAIFEEQYEVLYAADGNEACEIISRERRNLSIVFLDLIMPNMNGLEVLAFMRFEDLLEYIPVILITTESAVEADIRAYEYGAADIIHKPFSNKVVIRRSMNLMEQYKHRNQMEKELEQRTREVLESQEQLSSMNEFLLDALGSVVEFRSLESGDHVQRVKTFTRIILEYVRSCYPEYGLTASQIRLMSQAAALHDVGKIAIPDEILKAPRKLTKEEFDEMKRHTTYGCEILEKFRILDNDFYRYCYDICRWHHEKYDGKGYPDGLKGDEIPIYCQAAAIADCFDALVSKRVYKDAFECLDAYNMIARGECGVFSDVILRCFELAKLEMFMTVTDVRKQQKQSPNV